jgi:hypothetical protein
LVLRQKDGSMVPCIIVHHPCPHPPRSGNTGDTSIPRIYLGKHQEFQGWYSRTVKFLLWTEVSYRGWFPNETTVRNINYSIPVNTVRVCSCCYLTEILGIQVSSVMTRRGGKEGMVGHSSWHLEFLRDFAHTENVSSHLVWLLRKARWCCGPIRSTPDPNRAWRLHVPWQYWYSVNALLFYSPLE